MGLIDDPVCKRFKAGAFVFFPPLGIGGGKVNDHSAEAVNAYGPGVRVGDFMKPLSVMDPEGVIKPLEIGAEEMVAQGKRALDVLPPSSAKETLLELADYMIRRRY